MTQETAKAVIDRLQGEAGYATGGYVDRLVFSGLDVHEMLNEIEQAIDTDKLSVEKLEPIGYYNEAHGFLHDEFDKDCYCQGGCSMEAVYTESQVKKLTGENKVEKLQEQLNTAKKYIEHAIGTIKHDGHLGTIQTDWILSYLEKVLAAIGNEGSGDE